MRTFGFFTNGDKGTERAVVWNGIETPPGSGFVHRAWGE